MGQKTPLSLLMAALTYITPCDYDHRHTQAKPGECIPKAIPNKRGEQTDQSHNGQQERRAVYFLE
jgi:hypothetical protein